ncbi:unnamed protein product, partial [Closterium sp. NIES-53]
GGEEGAGGGGEPSIGQGREEGEEERLQEGEEDEEKHQEGEREEGQVGGTGGGTGEGHDSKGEVERQWKGKGKEELANDAEECSVDTTGMALKNDCSKIEDIESGAATFSAPDATLPASSSPPRNSLPLFCCAPPLAKNAFSASGSANEENPGEFTAIYPSDLHIANPKEVTSTSDEVEKLRKDEKDRERRRLRTRCCRVACWSLIVLAVVIVGLGVAGLVAYLTVSKQQPEVKVEQINIIRVGITKSGGGFLGLENFRLGLSALINVTALVYNPNNWEVEAENISVDVKFFDMNITIVTVPGVVGMSKGGSAELTVPLDIVDAPLATLSPASLLTTPLLHGRAEMRVVVGTAARVKYWGISSPRVMVHVECTMQLDPFSAKKYNEQCTPSISL